MISQHPRLCANVGLVLFAALIALNQASADASSANVASSSLDGADLGVSNSAPKRQYLIAPRVGRSSGGSPAIWSAFEEATMNQPGQVQANRGFPSPLRSSLLFLVGNRRLIGQRSGSGLLPQARVGRRSAPMGLMPQPRVGRRSQDGAVQDGEQEVAISTLSDTSLDDAIESLISLDNGQ